jgi:hypothetical protein
MRENVPAAGELLPSAATRPLPTLTVIAAIGLAAVLIAAAVAFAAAGNPAARASEPLR